MMLATLLLAGVLAQAPPNSTTPADPLRTLLTEAQLSFDDIDGYKLRYNLPGDRKQVVFIRKAAETYNSLKTFEAFSVFYESAQTPDAALLQKLFKTSFSIGGLVLEPPSAAQTKWRIRFRLEVRANESLDRLRNLLIIIANTGDSMEKNAGATEDKQ